MIRSDLRARIRAHEHLLGTFVQLASPDVAELAGLCGFDFVVIDLEHAAKDWPTVQHMIRAVEGSGSAPLVRTAGKDVAEILHVLEAGAAGVVVPFVETADDVRAVRDAARYAPAGRRGTCTVTRAAQFGLRREDFDSVTSNANERVVLLAQIESRLSAENIDEMKRIPYGFDGFIIGRSDLAADLGHPGEVDHPTVRDATENLVGALAHDEQAALGMVSYSTDELVTWAGRGVTVSIYAADTAVLALAYRQATRAFRRQWPEARRDAGVS